MRSEATPWRSWLRAASVLGLAPAAFWRLSVAEWLALTARPEPTFLTRAAFGELTRRFPDERP